MAWELNWGSIWFLDCPGLVGVHMVHVYMACVTSVYVIPWDVEHYNKLTTLQGTGHSLHLPSHELCLHHFQCVCPWLMLHLFLNLSNISLKSDLAFLLGLEPVLCFTDFSFVLGFKDSNPLSIFLCFRKVSNTLRILCNCFLLNFFCQLWCEKPWRRLVSSIKSLSNGFSFHPQLY